MHHSHKCHHSVCTYTMRLWRVCESAAQRTSCSYEPYVSGYCDFSLLLLVTFAFFARKTAIILAAAFVICSPPLFNLCPVNLFRSVPDGENSFTVMTYNVCNLTDFTNPTSDCTTNPTLAAILSERPDIAALQECQTFEHSRSAEVNTDMLDSLYNIYPYRTNGAEGQALLSKFPFEELKLHFNTTHIFKSGHTA